MIGFGKMESGFFSLLRQSDTDVLLQKCYLWIFEDIPMRKSYYRHFFRKIYHGDEFSCFTRFALRKLITEHRKSGITDTVSWRWRQNLFFLTEKTKYTLHCIVYRAIFGLYHEAFALRFGAFVRYSSKSFMYNGKAAFVFNFKRK